MVCIFCAVPSCPATEHTKSILVALLLLEVNWRLLRKEIGPELPLPCVLDGHSSGARQYQGDDDTYLCHLFPFRFEGQMATNGDELLPSNGELPEGT